MEGTEKRKTNFSREIRGNSSTEVPFDLIFGLSQQAEGFEMEPGEEKAETEGRGGGGENRTPSERGCRHKGACRLFRYLFNKQALGECRTRLLALGIQQESP